MQVPYLGRAPRTKETLPDFLKWRQVTRHPLVFRGLTGSQRTPRFWGVTGTYEALYGRPCRSPICWAEVGESSITGPDLIRDTSENVSLIRQRLLTAQSRQKSYADRRRRPLEFEVGDHVFLKEMPKR